MMCLKSLQLNFILVPKMLTIKWIHMSGRKNQEMKVHIQLICVILKSDFIHWIGSSVINIRKFWEKLMLAARAIAAVENSADVCAISCQPQGKNIHKWNKKEIILYYYLTIRPTCSIEICKIYRCYSYW